MSGFNIFINGKSGKSGNSGNSGKEANKYKSGKIKGQDYLVNYFTVNKFFDDKLFFDDENFVIVLDGVILNKVEIQKQNSIGNWSDCVRHLYLKNGETFFKEFRGSFCGALFDKKKSKWIIYTDHIGSKILYFTIEDKSLFVSSQIADVYHYFKMNGISYSLDKNAAYMLLSYGYMLNDTTLCDRIKRILPGQYLIFENEQCTSILYYTLKKVPFESNLKVEEIMEVLDDKFKKAVSLQFEKDKEYGYKYLVSLSGGLDSRMTSWVAHSIGYVNQLNVTFSQSDYLDEVIAKKIASDLKHEWLFKALDNGSFLEDIDIINRITGGNILYYGLAHGNSLMKYLNFENLGIWHTGQLGDIVVGSFLKNLNKPNIKDYTGAYSNRLLNKVRSSDNKRELDIELSLIYQRGFNGANNGLLAMQEYTETISPFYNIEFFEFCLSIPLKYRVNHSLYKKWILMKYPEAANYIWESTKKKITSKTIKMTYRNKNIAINQLMPLILYKLGFSPPVKSQKAGMNPLEYWYKTNDSIKRFQDQYFEDNRERLTDPDLKSDCLSLYNTGTAIEKNQVLTLLSALKLFY